MFLSYKRIFPNLNEEYFVITSPKDTYYNCIAWAAGDSTRWWWPESDSYWPAHLSREATIKAFTECFADLGYVESSSDTLEIPFDKIALYVDSYNMPTHAARQLRSGNWTSKLGKSHDIEHSLMCLEGQRYGSVKFFFKKKRI